ncbi:MAG: hypothetical protein U5L45_09335 [Saprospiraceae bacterium]|nr:hypothetical protein [Saprospiraceae bacterium]
MWFVFRLRRKTNHVSSLLRERSARKTSVFNQKTMFLGYAHSSIIILIQNLLRGVFQPIRLSNNPIYCTLKFEIWNLKFPMRVFKQGFATNVSEKSLIQRILANKNHKKKVE